MKARTNPLAAWHAAETVRMAAEASRLLFGWFAITALGTPFWDLRGVVEGIEDGKESFVEGIVPPCFNPVEHQATRDDESDFCEGVDSTCCGLLGDV